MKNPDATNLMSPVELTEREAEAVAGGATLVLGRLGGCPGCTSGGYLDLRTTFAQVVDPVESVTAVAPAGV